MEEKQSFLKSFFSFNLIVIFGIVIALFVNMIATEAQPIASFLFAPTLYIISTLLAVGIRIVLWLTMEKGTMYEAGHVFLKAIQDIIVINVVILSTLSFLFLWETFIH